MEEVQLLEIVEKSGLEVQEQKTITDKFSNYEAVAKEWEIKAKQIVVTDESQTTEMEMAKTARKKFSDLRIDLEKTRKAMKEQSLRKSQAIDSIAKYLKSLIEPIELYLKEQENFVVNKKAKEAEMLKIEAEKKEEAERVAKEKAEREEQDRIRKENEKLKLEAELKERQLQKELLEQQKKLKDEEDKLKAEKEKRDLIEANLKAESDKKLREEREAREKVEKELKEAKELEERKQLEEKQAIENQKRLEEEAKLKEQQAPEKDKMVRFADVISNLELPEVSSENYVELVKEVKSRLEDISNYIKKEIN